MPDPSNVTLILPGDTRFPAVHDQWRRQADGRIRAEFTVNELLVARLVYDLIFPPAPVQKPLLGE